MSCGVLQEMFETLRQQGNLEEQTTQQLYSEAASHLPGRPFCVRHLPPLRLQLRGVPAISCMVPADAACKPAAACGT